MTNPETSAFASRRDLHTESGAQSDTGSHEKSSTRRRSGPADIEQMVPVLYAELRRAASRQLRRAYHRAASGDASLGTTALVNEAYLKLADRTDPPWRDRTHFMALAALAMRQILIDRARAHARLKRSGAVSDFTLDDDALAHDSSPQRLLEINDAIDRLSALAPRLGRVVEYRFFGGMSDDEIAETLAVTARTVQRDWLKARALLRELLGE